MNQKLYDDIAQELGAVRDETLALIAGEGRYLGLPGLQGIARKAGKASVEAILSDSHRAVARVLADADPTFSYARFWAILDGKPLPEPK